MSRLPVPGSDDGTWGGILNDFLTVEHNPDGTLKKAGTIASAEQTANKGVAGGYASLDGSGKVPAGQIPASGSVPDADATTKGVLRLTGDLGGTATTPTVPGLAAKATDTAVVHNTGAETIAGVKTFSSAPVVPSSSFPESAVTNLTTDLAAKESTANKGAASGYAPLDSGSKVPTANLPLPLAQSQTHASPDTDASASSLHHTLGSGANQAAAGNHTHTLATMLPAFTKTSTLTTTTGTLRLPIDGTYSITGVRLMAGTAPTGANLIVDINKNGTTIFSTQANRPKILDGANAGGPGTAPDVTSLAAGDYLTVDIDQIGSTVAGADLVVTVLVTKTVT